MRKELEAIREENIGLKRLGEELAASRAENKELRGIIEKLLARIAELERKVSLLQGDADSDNDDDDGPGSPGDSGYLEKVKKKPGKQFGKKKKKKSRGARKGHAGHGRAKCQAIDREVDLTLECCPDCGGELTQTRKPEVCVQEDLVITKVATKFSIHRYACEGCGLEVKPVFAGGFIGPVTKSFTTLLHYYSGVPFGKIREMLGWFGFRISEGTLALWGKKLGEKFENFYDGLKEGLKSTAYVNVDETGWPVDGKNRWMWVFRSPESVLYTIDRSRGSRVVEDVLGNSYNGVLGSDFFSAYNPMDCQKQKCHVHLLREVRGWDESKSFEKRAFHYGMHRVFEEAKALSERKDELPKDVYERKATQFIRDFESFLENRFSDADCTRLMKRLSRHRDELWTFLSEDVPHHNNAAELALRRVVVNRKVSNGNRSDVGARVQEVLLSTIQTARLQGKNLLETLLNPKALSWNTS